jgi:hypothetical protein
VTQANGRRASTGAGAAWFQRRRSSRAEESVQVLERQERERRRAGGANTRVRARE